MGDFCSALLCMSMRKQHYFVHYYCHHTVRYIQIFFTTLKVENWAWPNKCAPPQICLLTNKNLCIYLQTWTVCVTNCICTYNVILCVISAKYTPLSHNVSSRCVVRCSQRRTIYHAEYLHTLVSNPGALNAL